MAESTQSEPAGATAESPPEEQRRRPAPHRARLPGFIAPSEDVGLGDVIKRATGAAGIRTCGGCEQRAQALNRWVVFTR
jgi:hypothetical protein